MDGWVESGVLGKKNSLLSALWDGAGVGVNEDQLVFCGDGSLEFVAVGDFGVRHGE
jgi:hypothetical protein